MLLKSSLIILLLLNIFLKDIKYIAVTTLCLFIMNIIYNRQNIKKDLNKIKIIFILYFITCIMQIFYNQEGKVLFSIFGFYITYEGVTYFLLNLLRITNLFMISWIITGQKMINGRFGHYQVIVDKVIELLPSAFDMIKKRMKLKNYIRYILKEIK